MFFFVLCDSHGIQLFIKKILELPAYITSISHVLLAGKHNSLRELLAAARSIEEQKREISNNFPRDSKPSQKPFKPWNSRAAGSSTVAPSTVIAQGKDEGDERPPRRVLVQTSTLCRLVQSRKDGSDPGTTPRISRESYKERTEQHYPVKEGVGVAVDQGIGAMMPAVPRTPRG